jgi:2-iminobutanoate/2-iminopropanoate deaminase
LISSDIRAQTEQALRNLDRVLVSIGSGLHRLLLVTCYLASRDDFVAFDDTYSKVIGGDRVPARATVEATLVMSGALVEIVALAAVG